MALVPKTAADIDIGDQLFTLRTVTKITRDATSVILTYDDGSDDTHDPADTLQTGDPTS